MLPKSLFQQINFCLYMYQAFSCLHEHFYLCHNYFSLKQINELHCCVYLWFRTRVWYIFCIYCKQRKIFQIYLIKKTKIIWAFGMMKDNWWKLYTSDELYGRPYLLKLLRKVFISYQCFENSPEMCQFQTSISDRH